MRKKRGEMFMLVRNNAVSQLPRIRKKRLRKRIIKAMETRFSSFLRNEYETFP